MSDRERRAGPTPRPASRKTQRYISLPHNADDEGRRNIAKAIGIGAGVTLVGGAGVTLIRLAQGNPDSRLSQPSRQPTPTHLPRAEDILPPDLLSYFNKIVALNEEVRKNPNAFKEIAPRIGEVAIQFFCKEMGYDSKNYQGKINYYWNDEYTLRRRGRVAGDGCGIQGDTSYQYGNVNPFGDSIEVNLSKALYNDLRNTVPVQFPAFTLFGVLIHELHHLTSPLLQNPESNDPQEKIRGMGLIKPIPELNNLVCYVPARRALEEAIVEDSSQKMYGKLGIQADPSPDYKVWIARYRTGVIDRFFSGDHRPLLMLHQRTRQREYFISVGEKLGVFSPEAQRQEGEAYLGRLLTQGIM